MQPKEVDDAIIKAAHLTPHSTDLPGDVKLFSVIGSDVVARANTPMVDT